MRHTDGFDDVGQHDPVGDIVGEVMYTSFRFHLIQIVIGPIRVYLRIK